MGPMLKILIYNTLFLIPLSSAKSIYDNLNINRSAGINCSETLDKLVVLNNMDYSVEDFTDYSQDQDDNINNVTISDIPKSRQPRSIKRVLSWVGRGFGKVFNSPYIYNFYPIINYSVGKIMQHLPFMGNSQNNPGQSPTSDPPDYPQQSSPTPPNPKQLAQQQQMQHEYEEEMEKKQREMQQKQEEAEEHAKHAALEKKIINERAKKLAAKYVELYFAKQSQSSQTTTVVTLPYDMMQQNYAPGGYNLPAQPAVYDQAYVQPNYAAAYPAVDNVPEPEPVAYNPPVAPVNYVNA